VSRDEIQQSDRAWLEDVLRKHERLAPGVLSLLQNMLEKEDIEYLSIGHRVKSLDGAIEKIQRKSYSDPKRQLTDLSGVRVITYLQEQVDSISNLIRQMFEIDQNNSHDRSADLGHDRIGYRSTHFVCTLGAKRDVLPEWESLGSLPFEIQVRTVLQHSWAELAHDGSFKFGSALPTKIQRKLNLYSGMLEIVDDAFDQISKEIDEYSATLDKKTPKQIKEVEVDSLSIEKFAVNFAQQNDITFKNTTAKPGVIDELKKFGIETVGDFANLISKEFIGVYKEHIRESSTMVGFIRSALLFADLERYLRNNPPWELMSKDYFDMLCSKYGTAEVKTLLDKYERKVSDGSTK
jgi:putative GTP pyrophosphokinase